jgi:hypothetical protein
MLNAKWSVESCPRGQVSVDSRIFILGQQRQAVAHRSVVRRPHALVVSKFL